MQAVREGRKNGAEPLAMTKIYRCRKWGAKCRRSKGGAIRGWKLMCKGKSIARKAGS